jgi:hypothetical protein
MKKCCRNCLKGQPCCKKAPGALGALGEQAAGKFHTGGVTQLSYVGDADGLGLDTGVLVPVVHFGLLAMGVACLLGMDRRQARWVGIAGVGYALLRR